MISFYFKIINPFRFFTTFRLSLMCSSEFREFFTPLEKVHLFEAWKTGKNYPFPSSSLMLFRIYKFRKKMDTSIERTIDNSQASSTHSQELLDIEEGWKEFTFQGYENVFNSLNLSNTFFFRCWFVHNFIMMSTWCFLNAKFTLFTSSFRCREISVIHSSIFMFSVPVRFMIIFLLTGWISTLSQHENFFSHFYFFFSILHKLFFVDFIFSWINFEWTQLKFDLSRF